MLIYTPRLSMEMAVDRIPFHGKLLVLRTPVGRFYWADRHARPYLLELLAVVRHHPERLDAVRRWDNYRDERINTIVNDRTSMLEAEAKRLRDRESEWSRRMGEMQNDILSLERTIKVMSRKRGR